jgi:hypothetical protein
MPRTVPFATRFESFLPDVLDDDKCWLWRGYISPTGYGRIAIGGGRKQMFLAHRVAWEMHHAQPIPGEMVIMHKCDTPACVNPAHLELGTQADNIQDMVKKRRHSRGKSINRGTANGQAKLTLDQALAIRKSCDSGLANQSQLAQQYGISVSAISLIVTGQTWRHSATELSAAPDSDSTNSLN